MKTKITLEEIDKYLREQYAIRPTVMQLIEAEGDLSVIYNLGLDEPDEEEDFAVADLLSEANYNLLTRCENEHFSISLDRQEIEIELPFHLHYLGNMIDTASLITLADCINMYFTLKSIPEQTYCISAYYQIEVDNDSFPGPNVYMVKANSEDEALQKAAKKIWELDHANDSEIDWKGFFEQCTFVNSSNKETIKEKAEEEGWVLSICNIINVS